ncbi:hypothetical protein [Dryocola sp. BD626]|uniref:hypothetical protein n=1 Tax=Dryocola sp. BD626 TaxID=3133273 RepID=UPI003F4FB4F7
MKTMTNAILQNLSLTFFFSIMISTPSQGGETYKMNMTITGTVTATGKCLFAAPDQQIDLGDIIVSRPYISTNTRHYVLVGEKRADLDVKMQCSGDFLGKTKMTLRGSMGEIQLPDGRKVLQFKNAKDGSLNTVLGLGLIVDGNAQDVGTPFEVDMNQQPRMEVEVVQIADGSSGSSANGLTDGDSVTSGATLVMEFD